MRDDQAPAMNDGQDLQRAARLSVAPMMDWTDRHCRYLHRQISREALLYTEMVTAPALVRGGARHLLEHNSEEHPVALQLGGSVPAELGQAARMGAEAGYDEINLNCGCPSDRVKSGCFGAVLMQSPELVAESCAEMIAAQPREVTVKCRLGVDEQVPEEVLPRFLEAVAGAGVRRVTIHARKAWLQGLSPKENRTVPPLDYALIAEMKRAFPQLHVSVNGGVQTLGEACRFLEEGLDGVMVGRAAYHTPMDVLGDADRAVFGGARGPQAEAVVQAMLPYIERHLSEGGKLAQVTRHMLGLFAGRPGARAWRRVLSEEGHRNGAGTEVVERALAEIAASQEAVSA